MVKLVNKNNLVANTDFVLHSYALQLWLVLLSTFINGHVSANEWPYSVQSHDNLWKESEKFSALQTELMSNEVLPGMVGIKAYGVERSVIKKHDNTAKKIQLPVGTNTLLPAPDLSAIPNISHNYPILFSWHDLTGANKYRLQIAANAQFDKLLIDTITDISEYTLKVLPDGDYAVRIRGIDEMGFEGFSALHEFTLDLKPAAPIPLNPKHWTVIKNTPIKFWWAIPKNINRYHFQLSRNINFNDLIIDNSEITNSYLILNQTLEAGDFYWRISSLDDDGNMSSYSAIQFLSVKNHLKKEPTESKQATSKDRQINLQWLTTPETVGFHLQLANDEDFKHIIVDLHTELDNYFLPVSELASNSVYYRMTSIFTDGSVNPYTVPQRIEIHHEYSPLTLVFHLFSMLPIIILMAVI